MAITKTLEGRPTKYDSKYCMAIVRYFKECEVVRKIVDDPSGRGGTNTKFETMRVPSIQGFATSIDVHVDTIYEWAKVHPEFSDALSRAESIQKGIVFEYGMAGRLDRGLAAMYFTNKLDFKNKSEIDQKTELSGNLNVEVVSFASSGTDPNPPAV